MQRLSLHNQRAINGAALGNGKGLKVLLIVPIQIGGQCDVIQRCHNQRLLLANSSRVSSRRWPSCSLATAMSAALPDGSCNSITRRVSEVTRGGRGLFV